MILDKDIASSHQWAHRAPEGWHLALASYYQTPENDTSKKHVEKTAVIVPIHNEERSLESFLNALMVADLSPEAAIRFLFITNACQDQSPTIIRKFLGSVDKRADTIQTPPIVTDPNVDSEIFEARVGNTSLLHLNTQTKGKANALRLGNELAIQSGHPIAMSVDANVYPEANALQKLYDSSSEAIVDQPESGIVVIHGSPYREHRATLYSQLVLKNKRGAKPSPEVKDLSNVNGWMLGWDTNWFKTIEDRIQVAVEDYAIGLLARVEGYHTLKVPDIKIWGYKGSTLRDDFRERVRAMRGMMQLMGLEPDLEDKILQENVNMRPLSQRFEALVGRLSKNPARTMLQILNFGLYEAALLQARREFEVDPNNQSWPEIASSK